MSDTMSDTLTDSFSILELPPTASEAEIKKAYRKLSLKLHPDKVGKDVEPSVAATRFHRLNLAYETLMDPVARAKASQKCNEDAQRKARQEKYQGKRKAMADELERQENEARRQKAQQREAERKREEELNRLMEEGRRLREQRQRQRQNEADAEARVTQVQPTSQRTGEATAAASAPHHASAASARVAPLASTAFSSLFPTESDDQPSLGPLDLTVRLRFPTTHYDYLIGHTSLPPPASTSADPPRPPADPLATPLAIALSSAFGPLQSLHLQLPDANPTGGGDAKKRKKSRSEMAAFATFEQLLDAWHAVDVGAKLECPGDVLADVWIGWVDRKNKKRRKRADHGDGQDEGVDEAKVDGGGDGEVEDAEPKRVKWYKAKGIGSAVVAKQRRTQGQPHAQSQVDVDVDGGIPSQPPTTAPRFGFSFKPPIPSSSSSAARGRSYGVDLEYESATLQRLRDAERKRVELDILRAEQAQEHAQAQGEGV
ncbi:hypothetical protein ACQY0O_008455 [Thecaphora frezii]